MAMNQNGRSPGRPDENRPSSRAYDSMRGGDYERGERWREDDERRFDRDRDRDRFGRERTQSPWMGGHWEDDRDEAYHGRGDWMRDAERYGQGQSGYGAGRWGDDRSMRMEQRNPRYGGIYEDRQHGNYGVGVDERWTGRGGEGYWMDRDRDRPGFRGGGYDRESGGPRGYGWNQRGMGGIGSMTPGRGYRGKGPKNFLRSDERIREAVCEALSDDDNVDASEIEVQVKGGEVTLVGTVEDRHAKRAAEDCVEHVPGVKDVQNQLKVHGREAKHRT